MTRLPPKASVVYAIIAKSGGVCAMTDCKVPLVQEGVFNAVLAHITAASEQGPRFDATMTDEQRRDETNLMYMCPTHANLVDKTKLHNKYSVEVLRQMKAAHEAMYAQEQYELNGENLADAVDEAQQYIQQANSIVGDGNIQTNIQVVVGSTSDAADNFGEQMEHVAKLAKGIAQSDAVQSGLSSQPAPQDKSMDNEVDVDEPIDKHSPTQEPEDSTDYIESAYQLEIELPAWVETMQAITKEAVYVGKATEDAGVRLNASNAKGESLQKKKKILTELARKLTPPSESLTQLSEKYIHHVGAVDPGIRAIISMSQLGSSEPDPKPNSPLQSVLELIESTQTSMDSIEYLVNTIRPLEPLSKDLRKPLQTIRIGLEKMLLTRQAADEWKRLATEVHQRRIS